MMPVAHGLLTRTRSWQSGSVLIVSEMPGEVLGSWSVSEDGFGRWRVTHAPTGVLLGSVAEKGIACEAVEVLHYSPFRLEFEKDPVRWSLEAELFAYVVGEELRAWRGGE